MSSSAKTKHDKANLQNEGRDIEKPNPGTDGDARSDTMLGTETHRLPGAPAAPEFTPPAFPNPSTTDERAIVEGLRPQSAMPPAFTGTGAESTMHHPVSTSSPPPEAIRAMIRDEVEQIVNARFEQVMGDLDTRANNIARGIQQQAMRPAAVEPGTSVPPDGSVERRLSDLERDVRNVKAGKHI